MGRERPGAEAFGDDVKTHFIRHDDRSWQDLNGAGEGEEAPEFTWDLALCQKPVSILEGKGDFHVETLSPQSN